MGVSVAIIGRSELMYNTMLKIHEHGIKINYIITAKEAPEYKYSSQDFEKFAKKHNVGFLHTPNLSTTEIKSLEEKWGKANIGISVNYNGIISKDVIDKFPLGILNAHGGDLPRYRGNACMAWAIINSEKQVGLCIHKMIGGELDSGAIINREYKLINIDTRIQELFSWMEERIPHLFLDSILKLKSDTNYYLETQSLDPKKALRCYPRNPRDGKINWKESNSNIIRLINASSEPFSGAFCYYLDQKIIIWRAELYHDDENYLAVPGQISEINRNTGEIIIICGVGKLKIIEIQVNDERINPSFFFKSIRQRLI